MLVHHDVPFPIRGGPLLAREDGLSLGLIVAC